jgi:RHS repeat-associated protein
MLETAGTGNFTYGYLGGLMDTSTGLLYMGSGQYYDPTTGRFQSRNEKPDQTNPYVPWGGNPTGALFTPLALLSLVYSRRKKRGTLDMIIVLMMLGMTLSMSLTACVVPMPSPAPSPLSPDPGIPRTGGGTPEPTTTPPSTPSSAGTPTNMPTICLGMPVPNGISGDFTITHYTIPEEDDHYFHRDGGYDGKGGGFIPLATNNTWKNQYAFISVYAFAVGNTKDDHWSVLVNGSGFLNEPGDQNYGKYLHVAVPDYSTTFPYSLFEILDGKPTPCGGSVLESLRDSQEVTIAVNEQLLRSGYYTCGEKFTIDLYPGKIFKIGDGGTFQNKNDDDPNHFDIYVGEMHKEDFDRLYPQPLSGYVQQVQ